MRTFFSVYYYEQEVEDFELVGIYSKREEANAHRETIQREFFSAVVEETIVGIKARLLSAALRSIEKIKKTLPSEQQLAMILGSTEAEQAVEAAAKEKR